MAQPGVILEFHRPFTTAVNDSSHMLANATTVVVDDASGFLVGSILFIQSEQVKITAINSNTLTVLRAQNGTSAAQHNDNTAVSVGWIQAQTHAGNTAVLHCNLTKELNRPATAELILSNRSKNASSTDTAESTGALSDPTGERATLFTEFQDVRLIETETGLCLFRGRVYSVRGQYDMQYGNTVKLVAKDMLQELEDIELGNDDKAPALKSIDVDVHNSRSKLAAYVIDKLSDNFLTTDTSKYEGSSEVFTAEEKQSGDEQADGTYTWDVVTSASTGLDLVNLLGKTDPHDDDAETLHFGYDYYVDANVGSSALNSNLNDGKIPMHWFKRGSRPHASDIPKYGFTLEYPSSGWAGQTNFRRSMLSDAEFSNPNGAFFTSVVAHFEDTGDDEDAIKNESAVTATSFELVKGTVTGDFNWETVRLRYQDDGTEGGGKFTSTNTGVTPKQFNGQSTNTENPYFLFVETDHANAQSPAESHVLPCATVHYASGTGANQYLILSNVYKEDTTWTDPQGNAISFRAFPTAPSDSSYIRLHVAKSLGHSNTTTGVYFDIYNGARATERHNIHKPDRVYVSKAVLKNPFAMRKNIASILDRGSRTTVTIAKVRAARYPYVKTIARTTNYNNTRSGNTITFATNTFLAGDGSTTFTDPRTTGAKKGMVVAQLSKADGTNSSVLRYAYISAINGTTVTYGTSATDTSDGTALDVAYDIAIIVPVEAGYSMRLKNKLHGVDYDILVHKLDFSYSPGTLTAQIEGAGINGTNHNAAGTAPVSSSSVLTRRPWSNAVDNANMNKAIPPSSQKITVDGIVRAYDGNHVEIPGNSNFITVITRGDGKRYKIDKADGSTVNGYGYPRLEIGEEGGTFGGNSGTTDEVHVLFFRTKGAAYKSRKLQAIAVRRSSGSAKVYDDIARPDDIIIGTARKHSTANPSGNMCVVELNDSGAFGSGWPYDTSAVGSPLKTALLGKGAQHWSTNLRFEGTDYNSVRWGGTVVGNPASNSNATISFGDDDTEAITANTGTTFASGLSYIYKRVGDDANATLVVTTTYSDVTRKDTDRVLMATVVVAADVGQESPTIFPIGGNSATLSTGVFAARSIVAGDIKAGTITTNELAFSPSGITTFRQDGTPTATSVGDLWYDSDDGNKLYRATATGTGSWVEATLAKMEAGTMGGINVAATKLYIGTGTYGNSNTPFYVDNVGNFSMGNKLTWDRSTLTIYGSVVIGGTPASTVESRANNSFQGTPTKGTVGLPNVEDGDPQSQAQTGLNDGVTINGGNSGITLNANGSIKSLSKGYADSNTGFFLGYDSNAYKFDIGNGSKYFRWTGSDVDIVGGLTVGSGNTIATDAGSNVGIKMTTGDMKIYNTNSGRVAFYDENAAISLRIRTFSYYNQFDTFGRATWWLQTDRSSESSSTVATAQDAAATHIWTYPSNHFSPGIGNGRTYLGSPSDGGSSPNNYGVGWKALVLGVASTDAALVLKAHDSTVRQYRFTFPAVPATSSGYQLSSDLTGATSWTSDSSSLRYKENVRPLEIDSSKIYQLDPKSFNLIEGHISALGNNTFGYIAEEVDKILPEVVKYDNEDRPDSLNYQLLTVFLIEEIKKLRSRIEVLEEK